MTKEDRDLQSKLKSGLRQAEKTGHVAISGRWVDRPAKSGDGTACLDRMLTRWSIFAQGKAMIRQLAMEGAPYGIRANTISPGMIVTQQTRRHMEAVPEIREGALRRSMLKSLGEPEDIAWCATWLPSAESRFVAGADICIDGGATAW